MMRQGHLPMVIQLMRYGADPSIADGEGYRALHLAILFQHMAIAAYLMAKGQVRLHTNTVFDPFALWKSFSFGASLFSWAVIFSFCLFARRKSMGLTATGRHH